MKNKLKMWLPEKNWEEAEKAWDQAACEAEKEKPIKKLSQLPNMPGITSDTAKNLKWKSLKWMIAKDHQWKIFKHIMRHPLKYGWALIKSMVNRIPMYEMTIFFFMESSL